MALTDIKVRTAKPTDKQYKIIDNNGKLFNIDSDELFILMIKSVGRCQKITL